MSDLNEVEQAEAEESVINMFDEENEAPLTPSEEDRLKEVKESKILSRLEELRERVLAIKAAIEEDNFIEIFIKPIRGNIKSIKETLETVEKTRDLAMLQGQLSAYRRMLHFPDTAVDQMSTEIDNIKRDMPLFYTGNDLVKRCSRISFDETLYKIIIE